MFLKSLLFIVTILFSACGSNTQTDNDAAKKTTFAEESNQIKKIDKTVTLYVHGYSKDGYKRHGVFGDVNHDEIVDNLAYASNLPTLDNFTQDSTNILAVTPYYGDEYPSYYTQKDIEDLEKITQKYGGGIPRYATIIAKFAKYAMKLTNADHINIVSGSMGSLVTRWLIEKDVENLASQKKIKNWVSIEGVIRGNYAASSNRLIELAKPFVKENIDSKQMKYSWINQNLGSDVASSPYYKNIRLHFISSTHDKDGTLSFYLLLNQRLQPNDGVQLLKDTVFSKTPYNNPTYTNFYTDHYHIKDIKGVWADVLTDLSSKKRVKITLLNAQVTDLHEHIRRFFNKNAEMVFESEVKSPKIYEKYGIDSDLSQRAVNSGALNLIKYQHTNQTKEVNQLIFNNYVLEDENQLNIKITPYELDKVSIYGVRELSLGSSMSSLGTADITVALKNSTINVSGRDWSGTLKIEVTTDQ